MPHLEVLEEVPSRIYGVAAMGPIMPSASEPSSAVVSLTPRAFDLLLARIAKECVVLSRHDLLRNVWGHRAAILTRGLEPRSPGHDADLLEALGGGTHYGAVPLIEPEGVREYGSHGADV